MEQKVSKIENIIMKKKKFTNLDIDYIIHKTTNKMDLLTLNYIEKSLINKNGRIFIDKSKDKIEILVNLLLDDNLEKLYDFYSYTFDAYMKQTNNSFEGITSFNLVFVGLLHISLKIIRNSKE